MVLEIIARQQCRAVMSCEGRIDMKLKTLLTLVLLAGPISIIADNVPVARSMQAVLTFVVYADSDVGPILLVTTAPFVVNGKTVAQTGSDVVFTGKLRVLGSKLEANGSWTVMDPMAGEIHLAGTASIPLKEGRAYAGTPVNICGR
jgi:hypothetical protein